MADLEKMREARKMLESGTTAEKTSSASTKKRADTAGRGETLSDFALRLQQETGGLYGARSPINPQGRYAQAAAQMNRATRPASVTSFVPRGMYSSVEKQMQTAAPAQPRTAWHPMSALPSEQQLSDGAALHQQRQQAQEEAERGFWRSLWDSIAKGVSMGQNARAGYLSPAAMQQTEGLVRDQGESWRQAQAFKQQADELAAPIEWEGRQAMVDEYQRLQLSLRRDESAYSPEAYAREQRRLEAIRQELEQRDIAAGNGARVYSGVDRFGNVLSGTARNIGTGIVNSAVTMTDAMARNNAYNYDQEMNDFGLMVDPEEQRQRLSDAYKSEDAQTVRDRMYAAVDRMGGSAAADLERAKNGLGVLGQAGVDIAENMLEMGFDATVGAMTGGGSLGSMFVRVLGSSAREARLNGATLNEQLAYGLTSAGIEVLTEKLADGVAGIYGKGAADEITEELIRKLSQTDTGRSMLRLMIGALNEGGEEVIADLLSPFANAMYQRNDDGSRKTLGQLFKEQFSPEGLAEMLHDFLIGAAVGGIGGGGNFINGGNARANAELLMRDAGIGSVENQTDAAFDVLSGRMTPEQNEAQRTAALERLRRYGINEDGTFDASILFGMGQQNETAPRATQGADNTEGVSYGEQAGKTGTDAAPENRDDGLRAGEQTELPGQGEGAQPGGEGQVREGVSEGRGQNLRTVSLRELGVTNAAEGATIQVQDEGRLTGDAAAAAQQVRQLGMEPVAYQGDMVVNGGSVNGYIEDGKIFFRTDARYRDGTAISPDAIVRHEAVHQAKNADPEIIRTGMEIVRQSRSEADLRAMMEAYRETYKDIYDFEHMSEDMIADLMVEEIVADAYAGINYFRDGGETVEEMRAAIGSQVESSQSIEGQMESTGPPEGRAAIPIDTGISATVDTALNNTGSRGMNEIGAISEAENRAINRFANIRGDGFRGRFTGGKHLVSNAAIRHSLNEHSSVLREALRAQLPLTEQDIKMALSAIKNGQARVSAPRSTSQGNPSVIQTIPVNGYTLYAEEISHTSKERPADLIGHTMWKAPTLSTAAASGTSPVALPKRQRSMLSTYSIFQNGKKSTKNIVADKNGTAIPLYYEEYNGTPVKDNYQGGLIFLSAMRNVASQNSQVGSVSTGYAVMSNPFIITEENPVFRNSSADVAKAIADLRAKGYDGFVFDYHDGDRYAVMVFNDGQIISDQDFQNYSKEDSETKLTESGRASAEVTPELSDEERIRLFGEPEASDIVEAESYDRMEKKEAVQYAKDHNYPMLRRADGREEQAVPGWSWVRDNARKNYGRVIGDAIVNGEPGVEVEFYNKKNGTSRIIGKLPGEITLVDPQVGGRNVPIGEAPAETGSAYFADDQRTDEMMEEMVGDRTLSPAEPIGSKNPQRRETLREAYERRTEAYMAAINRNDTEYDYDGELAWIKRAEQLLAEQQKEGPKITEMENAKAELLEVGEATVKNDTGTYIMKVRKKGDKYQAQVFRNGVLDKSRTFDTPKEAAEFAAGWVNGRTEGTTDAELDAERSEPIEKPGPHWPTGREYGEEIVRQKKNKAADAATQTLRERIRRANEEIKALQRLERTTGLTERQRAHMNDVQETLDIMNDELTSRKGRRQAKKEKAGTRPAVENKPTRSAAEAKNALMDLFHTAPGTRAEVGRAIEAKLAEIARSGRITEESRQELYDLLIENGMVPKHAEDTFREIRRWLSGQRIFVNEQERADLGDDFEDLRRQAWGAGIYLTNDIRDGRIDSVNGELAETFGERLFPTDEALSDTLRNMIERANQGKTTQQSLADAIEDEASATGATADEIYTDMFNRMDETLKTFAEKAGLEVDLKNRNTQQLAKERQRWEERMESRAQQRRESEIRKKVMKGLQRLSKLRGKAGPEIRSDIDAVLKDIDTQARQITPTGLENLQDLQRAYEDARKAAGYVDGDNMGNWIPNPYVEEKLAALTKNHINDMSLEEVVDLGRTVAALETAIHNQNKMIGEEFDATIEETAKGVRKDVEGSKGAKPGFLHKWMMEEHLSPRRFLDMLGGWKNGTMGKLSKSLEDGQTRMLDFQRRAVQSFDSFLSKKANREWLKTASGKKATWEKYTVLDGMGENGTTYSEIELTPMMKISLYLHSRNMDNLRHIQTGGIVVPNKALYLKGKIAEAYAQGQRIKMNPETVRKIAGELTEQEKTFANHMITVFDSISKDAINEVSLQLDGFERAGVENYMPIETDRSFLKSDVAGEARAATVEGIGSIANERVHASNPIMLSDASDVLMRQIDKVSRYYGYAIPLRNFQAVNNFVFHENGNAFDTSIKEIINKKWGSGAEQYITKMLEDLQSSGRRGDMMSSALGRLRGNLAGATLMFNPSVAVSQTASYPGAAQAVGWDGLAAGLVAGRVDPKLIEKYSPLYWYRNQGNSTQELGDYMKEKSLEQKLPWVLNWIQKMDSATIRRLWAAAEYRVSKDNPGLKPGSRADIDAGKDAYYKAVAEVFNRAVYDTQPNYTNMERAQILRSESDLTKFLTMYKTVPLQYYGMMVEATGRLQAAMQSGDQAAITEARKYAANTFGGLLAANTVYVAMKALFKGFRKKDKDYRDEEGKLTAGSITKQLGKDLAETYAGSIIGGAEMLSVAESLLTGSKFYGPDMSALSYVEEMVGAVNGMFQAIGDKDPRKAAGAIKDAVITLAQGFGVPAKNMETYILAGVRWMFPDVAMEYDNLFGGLEKSSLKGLDENAVGTAVNLIMQNRSGLKIASSVTDELARLYSTGELAAIPSGTPSSFTYNGKTVEITDRGAYSDVWGAIVGENLEELVTSEQYQDLDDERRAALVNRLYQYATVEARRGADPEYSAEGNSTYGWTVKADEAVEAGVGLVDAICALEAFGHMYADKDENGNSIVGSKKAKVCAYIDAMDITDEQKDVMYLLSGYKENSLEYTPWHGWDEESGSGSGSGSGKKSGKGGRRGGRGQRSRAVKVPEGKGTGIIQLPKVSASRSGKTTGAGKSTGGMSGAADASLSLIEIIDKYYGGNALAAAMDGGARARGRTKVDFEV